MLKMVSTLGYFRSRFKSLQRETELDYANIIKQPASMTYIFPSFLFSDAPLPSEQIKSNNS